MITKPTVLDYAILGLIQDQPLSGYAILKMFKETALGNYSSSPGAIYPALKRLQKFELVKKIDQVSMANLVLKLPKKGFKIFKNGF